MHRHIFISIYFKKFDYSFWLQLAIKKKRNRGIQGWLIREDGLSCGECPVKKRTGLDSCRGTPWRDVYALFKRFSLKKPDDIWRKACQDEIDFLESLR